MLNGDIWPYANLFHNMTGSNDYDNMMNTDAPASFNYYSKYVELPAVRKMIHVGNAKFPFVRVMSHCWIYIQNCWFPRFCWHIAATFHGSAQLPMFGAVFVVSVSRPESKGV